jgi:CDP-diacylglycerol--serine O-phosphatidyltransferase
MLNDGVVAIVVLVLSYLMVSRVRFRSFKDLRLSKRTIQLALLVVGVWVAVAMNGVSKSLIFLVMILTYIALGLAETVLHMRRTFVEHRQEKRAQSETPPDEEVLRELGAFDGTDEN